MARQRLRGWIDGPATVVGSLEEVRVENREILPVGPADAHPGDCHWRTAVVRHGDGPGDAAVNRVGGKEQSSRLKGHKTWGIARSALRAADYRHGRARQHDGDCDADGGRSRDEPGCLSRRLPLLCWRLPVLSGASCSFLDDSRSCLFRLPGRASLRFAPGSPDSRWPVWGSRSGASSPAGAPIWS